MFTAARLSLTVVVLLIATLAGIAQDTQEPTAATFPENALGHWQIIDVSTDLKDTFMNDAFVRMQKDRELKITADEILVGMPDDIMASHWKIIRLARTEMRSTWKIDLSWEQYMRINLRYGLLRIRGEQLDLCYNLICPPDETRRPKGFDLHEEGNGNIIIRCKRVRDKNEDRTEQSVAPKMRK